MLHLLDESLEAFLRAEVPLSERDVDISFEAPDKDWGARVTGPTLNLFLWDLRRNLDEREGGLKTYVDSNGRKVRRPPLPRMDLRYLITAWTSEVRDEHSLLGSVLHALLLAPCLDPQYLRGPYASVHPLPDIQVAMPEGKDTADFWSALGGQLKPGLDLVITATVDAVPRWPLPPPVQQYRIAVRDAAAGSALDSVVVGGQAAEGEPGELMMTPYGPALILPDGTWRAVQSDWPPSPEPADPSPPA